MTLITIKKRSEFIRSNKFSKKIYTPNFIIQKLESKKNENIPHFGFTITKKIGSAILRNKIKRRLKNIMNDALKEINFNLNYSYILIAKKTVSIDGFERIKNTIINDFERIK